MRKLISLIFILIFISSSFAKGHLVIIGGGQRPDYMMEKIVELAGGVSAKFIIVPNASSDPVETGIYYIEEFKKYGVSDVNYILCDSSNADADTILQQLEGATGIYLVGGDQSRLTNTFNGTKFLQKLHEIYENGGMIAGTSAGAAVQSKIMITGNELIHPNAERAFATIQNGNIETVEGFGFITKAVIDQHHIARKRHNRVLSVILEKGGLLGIGIDESTAIVVNPDDTFEVLGEYTVLVYDATKAKNIAADEKNNLSVRNIRLHILKSGDKYNLITNEVIE